ncbi:MAG: family 43 glycosylhydrolase [Bacillota bacterium]|nr:family 43 glycosylhydrolase [Bacillota bacterium]
MTKIHKVIFILLTVCVLSFVCFADDSAVVEDINGDRAINMADVIILATHFNSTISDSNYDRKCDLNNDGTINMGDVIMLAKKFNSVLPSIVPTPTVKPTQSPTSTIKPTQAPTPTIKPTDVPVTLPPVPVFKDASVHDPSVLKTNGTYYIIGSHLASAKTNDLMQWVQISSSVSNTNPLIPNVYTVLKSTFDYAQTDTLWAGDIIQLKDGKYYMYYCACKGDSPLSALGVAVSSNIEGPYSDLGIILKSGMTGTSADGTNYNSTIHPNAVDPDAFFDKNGNMWMVYGSYSGGIFILKMDPSTAKPYAGQGYGKKLLGGNHSRIEGPFMLYSPDSDYYYLFLSFGGLTADGGYNLRVCRSRNPDGPFVDSAGKNMIDCHGPAGTVFDDKAIEMYGTKLIGNFLFKDSNIGYVSPGHNSAYYDAETKKYFNIFHSRFPGRGEEHQVRVHQMFINEDGWPIIAPQRYGGETIGQYTSSDVSGDYAFINHGTDISTVLKESVKISLNKDGTISGSVTGKWQLSGGNKIALTINGVNYSGVALQQWDNGLKKFVFSFSALMKNGNVAVWGSHL